MKVPEGKRNGPIILVELNGEPTFIRKRIEQEDKEYNDSHPSDSYQRNFARYHNEEITDQVATTFDTRTAMYADNSVYVNSKGGYIKKQGKRYYLGDFK